MKPHPFTAGPNPKVCTVCEGGPAHSLHVAYADTKAETDGAQAYRFIRGTRP